MCGADVPMISKDPVTKWKQSLTRSRAGDACIPSQSIPAGHDSKRSTYLQPFRGHFQETVDSGGDSRCAGDVLVEGVFVP